MIGYCTLPNPNEEEVLFTNCVPFYEHVRRSAIVGTGALYFLALSGN